MAMSFARAPARAVILAAGNSAILYSGTVDVAISARYYRCNETANGCEFRNNPGRFITGFRNRQLKNRLPRMYGRAIKSKGIIK
jgi:hypothetical protein